MFEKKRNITLGGVVRIKVINTPAYFKKLSREAYSLFETDEAIEMAGNILTSKGNISDPGLIPAAFTDKLMKMASKVSVTGGIFNEFHEALVSFTYKDKITIRHDVLAEITLKDGIVTKITPVPLPELFINAK